MGDFLGIQHRMFIQAFMWKKICRSDEVRSLYKKCHEKTTTQMGDLKTFVEKINSAINPMNMAIKKGTDELTGEDYYVLINAADNSISRLSSVYKRNELELFKKIITAIVESDDGRVTSITILNMSDEIKITRKEADDIIAKLAADGWICEKSGFLSFSTRAIVELQHFLREHFTDAVSLCSLCKNIVFQGDVCETCEKKIHHHCKKNYKEQTGRNCPTCA